MENPSKQLQPYERHIACFLSALLAGLGLYVAFESRQVSVRSAEHIAVQVVGAVKEARISLPPGATIDDVLTMITVDENADLTELDGTKKLADGEIIVVPEKGRITVYIFGAVDEPKVVVINREEAPGAVLQYIHLHEDADIASFLRRKKLRNGSIIEIKKKRRRSGKS